MQTNLRRKSMRRDQLKDQEWTAHTVSRSRMDCTYSVKIKNGLQIQCQDQEWTAHTVSRSRMDCTYSVKIKNGLHIQCQDKEWTAHTVSHFTSVHVLSLFHF